MDLSPQFRLQGALKACTRSPVECDFLVSARLNHLHILLLLNVALQRHVSEPDTRLVIISANMLSLVIQAILLKERLANSGTSLIWKVGCNYLPVSSCSYDTGGVLRASSDRHHLPFPA